MGYELIGGREDSILEKINSSNQKKKLYEDRLPDPLDVLSSIDKLRNLDLTKISDDAFADLVTNYFNITPFNYSTAPANSLIFRARLNKGMEPFSSVKKIYVPPADKIKNYGRANKPGERVFYGAANYCLAAYEVLQDKQNNFITKDKRFLLTVGVWKVLSDFNILNIIDDTKIHNIRPDIFQTYQESQKSIFRGILKETKGLKAAISESLMMKYFAEEFSKKRTKKDPYYRVSNFYISSLKKGSQLISPKYQDKIFEGINYPSVAMNYKGDNQAIFIESADKKLELVDVLLVQFRDIDFKEINFKAEILGKAKSIINDKIVW